MHTLYKNRPKHPTGETLWRNPTGRTLRIKYMTDTGAWDLKTVQPGGQVRWPAKWPNITVNKLCPFLVTEGAYQEILEERAAEREDAEDAQRELPQSQGGEPKHPAPPPPPPPTEPLGDGDTKRMKTNNDGTETDSGRSSGDALEAFANDLVKTTGYKDLQGMAKDLELPTSGKAIDIARRLATAMAADPEPKEGEGGGRVEGEGDTPKGD